MRLSLLNRAVVAELVAKSCQDAEFRKAFLADPASRLAEAGFEGNPKPEIQSPESSNPDPRTLKPAPWILAHENTPDRLHIVLPPASESAEGKMPFFETPREIGPALGALIRRALVDAGLRRELLTDATACVAAAGIVLPPGMELVVVENADDALHIVLPVFPEPGALGVEELRMVVGGAYVVTFDSAQVGNTVGNNSFTSSSTTEYTFLYAGAMQSLQVLSYTGQAVAAADATITWLDVAQTIWLHTTAGVEVEAAEVSLVVSTIIAVAEAEVNIVAVASVVMT